MSKCCVLLRKNFRAYARFEIIVYLLIPLSMLHFIWLRSSHNNENMTHCFANRNGTLGDIRNLNALYNSVDEVGDEGPLKMLLVYTENKNDEKSLLSELKRILKLQQVIPADSEERLADMLKDGNYLGGIVSKGETFTIRFPSVLRTAPLDLWKTSQLQVDSDKSDLVYVKEGFLQVMYATIFATEPMKIYIPSQPFNSDSDYQNKLQKMIRDPLKAARENILPLYFSTLYMYPFIRLVMHMEREKNLQLRDLMSISRASAFVQYISWFLSSFILLGFINWMTIFILKAPLCDNGNILNCSSFTALFLFFTVWAISGICFCFFTYVLFQTLILGCFFLAYFCLISYVLYLYVDVTSFPLRALLSLNFQFGFLTGIKQILRYEDVDCTGLQWEHYTKSDRTSFFFGIIPIMMIVGAFILLMLCCVFEECCPGRYGVSTFKRHSRFSKNDSIAYMRARTSNIINPAVVQTIMLRKSQHNKVPLRNFSMNMYDDQITVILGLSNSGKSAVINSISGSIPPDTGSVRIDNKDMFSNRSSTRKSLGLSPQHDALFDSLTVSQHMDFFATLRNIRRGAKWQAIERYLKALELWNYRNIKSRNLSPVHKRLLSVACAFCGNPRIILLDEPSERMEPCERRLLWNLLQMEKQCRTIIVTTYQIEEADFLGDRISILCDGQLIFNGTSTFLKNVYGSGYQLVCPQGEICQEPQITLLVMKYIPETRLSPEKIYEVSYNIPQENNLAIVPLLKELESTSNYLNMGAIGIGTTPTLEKFVNATLPQYNNCTVKCDYSCNLPKPDECLLRGGRLLMNQWKAMLSKKAYHMKYNWFLFFPLFFLLLFSFAAAHKYFFPKPVPLSYYKDNKQGRLISQKPLKLNENPYKSMCKIALVKDEEQKSTKASIYEEKYKSLKEIGCTVEKIKKDDFETKQKLFQEKYIFALQVKNCTSQLYYNPKWLHSEAVAAAMIKYLANSDLSCSGYSKNMENPSINLRFIHHPYEAVQYSQYAAHQEISCFESGYLYLILLCISILSGFFAAFIIRERVIGFKLLQQVEGINMATFWLAHLLWDWFWLELLSMALLLIMFLSLGKQFDDELVGYVIALTLFNLALLTFLYIITYFFNRAIFAWLLPTAMLSLLAIAFVLVAPDIPFGILYLIPTYSAIAALHSVCIHASSYRFCTEENSKKYADCSLHPHVPCIWPALPYLLVLLFSTVLFFSVILLCERGSNCVSDSRFRGGMIIDDHCNIRNMTRNELRNHPLVLKNVKTDYVKAHHPIKGVSFGMKPMDVVGLVGERSGKTTIHKVIVSEMKVSGGVVYVKGINVHSHKRNKFKAYKYMGYCPQLNYFEPQFTGRENLKIFCLIRGIRPLQVREISEELAENLNFKEHLNKRSKNYTVSDKRKLSIAIAVIGTPPLILLDEPTAGVEMAHRSDVLDILKGVNECGSSILLSSNNMEDFQSLCTRLVLLKRGKLVRIGPVESFKGNATRGLVLLIKIRPYTLQRTRLQRSPSNEDQSVQNITWFLLTYFERVYLLEKNQRDVIYYIYSTSIPLAKAFEIIEKNRVKLNISEYFLRQENMELTFVTQNFRILK